MDKKARLIHALEKELPHLNNNSQRIQRTIIKHLQTGEKPKDWEELPDLVAVVEDFDGVCSDYGIE